MKINFANLHKIVFDELCEATFFCRHPKFKLEIDSWLLCSKKAYDDIYYDPDKLKSVVYSREQILDRAQKFANELIPNQDIHFHEVVNWLSVIHCASVTLIKAFFLDRVKQCANYGADGHHGVTPLEILEANYQLAKAFHKPPLYIYICSYHCPKYFLSRLLEGEDIAYIDNACFMFLSFRMADTLPSRMLEEVVNVITQKLDNYGKA